MKLTYLGHSALLIEFKDKTILFDPFISANPLASNINIDDLKVDYIFITHGHEDHVADVAYIAKKCNAIIVSNYEICSWFEQKGCHHYHPMNTGGTLKIENLGSAKLVVAIHSSTMPDGASGGNPGGFVFETNEGNFYFSGDTALTMDMKLIPLHTAIDFAIFPIGDNFTMGYKDAILASQFVETTKVVAVHYDTFGYIKIDKQKVKDAFLNSNIHLMLPEIGETIDI